MNILSIETSCDETAVSLIRADGDFPTATYTILGNALRSQIDLHREYGGVFPSLAKRDHAAIITTLCARALADADLPPAEKPALDATQKQTLHELLTRESGLADELIAFYESTDIPAIDMIAVTTGPGLEPALWVGINFARALSYILNVPLVPTNHMEGHILAATFADGKLADVSFPALALLISGGHTEFIYIRDWQHYAKIGQTRDDAVGEAFDKVARLLGLPYPGGPEISNLAAIAREKNLPQYIALPRPMLDSGDLDVSFSGIKTAVRYAVADKTLTDDERAAVAREFEEAVTDVLLAKTQTAIDTHGIKSLIIGGGVSANSYIRDQFTTTLSRLYPDLALYIPGANLSTDNSIMIALAGHAHADTALTPDSLADVRAEGNKTHRRISTGEQLFQ